MSKGRERRGAPRFDLAIEVSFESEHKFFTGLTEDLSGGGLFVATRALRPIGDFIRVRFSLPAHPGVLDAITEVRWVRAQDSEDGKAGLGLAFLQMSAATKEAIRTFVEKREAFLHRGKKG